jgi:hypothetical protein
MTIMMRWHPFPTYKTEYLPYVLHDWIPSSRVDVDSIALLNDNSDAIHLMYLSMNPEAIHLLEMYPERINWSNLLENTKGVHLLYDNLTKVDWHRASTNP